MNSGGADFFEFPAIDTVAEIFEPLHLWKMTDRVGHVRQDLENTGGARRHTKLPRHFQRYSDTHANQYRMCAVSFGNCLIRTGLRRTVAVVDNDRQNDCAEQYGAGDL